ncbi:MAG: alpha-hydroxy-acid oxidizing protein [Burkholderiaceae bacterium]|jgi:hypothetical protein
MIIASIDDYLKQCEARLPRFLYDYISGGSFQENTLRANIAELQDTLLRQRVMVDETRWLLPVRTVRDPFPLDEAWLRSSSTLYLVLLAVSLTDRAINAMFPVRDLS